MDREFAGDHGPYFRPERRSYALPLSLLALLVALGIVYYDFVSESPPFSAPPPTLASKPEKVAVPPPATSAPDRALEVPIVPTTGLPSLDQSDALMRDSLAGLLGREAFDQLVIPVQLVRRIVATVDNLPRATAPRRMMPLNAVPGRFTVWNEDGAERIAPANFIRYAPYVRVFESLDAAALVAAYVKAYPLFQRAYEQLGYPGKYFNERLVQAIDDLLLAPGSAEPAEVIRGRVLYEFADPELETRSAGQKIMLRMGADNAARVKAKLVEIRRELVAASRRP